MYRVLAAMMVISVFASGCGGPPAPPAPQTAAPKAVPPAEAAADEHGDEEGKVTELKAVTAGPYTVSAEYLGDLSDGHFNFHVAGGEVKAVRGWVGDEAATGAIVTKANWEDNHYCSPIEMPTELTAGAALWFEVEANDGTTYKGSFPLAGAAPAPAATADAPPPMRNFPAVKIGPYDVQPMFEEEIENGHYNIKIVSGGEVKAVRAWVGPEDASGVMVVKPEPEYGYHHGHYEVPSPVPADAKLWIEIESPSGEIFKGSTPLQLAQ